MVADLAVTLPEDVPFRDWLRAQREARGWSAPRLAREVAELATAEGWSNRRGDPPDEHSILKMVYRWEAGRAGISAEYLHLVVHTFADQESDDND